MMCIFFLNELVGFTEYVTVRDGRRDRRVARVVSAVVDPE